MAPPHCAARRPGRLALMIAIHDALRRELDQLLQAHRTRHLMPAVTGYGG